MLSCTSWTSRCEYWRRASDFQAKYCVVAILWQGHVHPSYRPSDRSRELVREPHHQASVLRLDNVLVTGIAVAEVQPELHVGRNVAGDR